uniref:Uncharacterized protein n=1 Tax=Anguilla anguilla TaxID=7936 RepID=A0A0E9QR29_ANGAN
MQFLIFTLKFNFVFILLKCIIENTCFCLAVTQWLRNQRMQVEINVHRNCKINVKI